MHVDIYVDINVILIAKVIPESSRVILDIHDGKHRKAIKRSEEIYFSTDGICHHVTRNNSSIIPELSSNQEEADTKFCLHTLHALAAVENGYVIVRNHSGDACGHLCRHKCYIDSKSYS